MSYNQFLVAEQVWLNFTFSSQTAHLTIIWGIGNIQIQDKENISIVIKLDNLEESWIAFAKKLGGGRNRYAPRVVVIDIESGIEFKLSPSS